MEIDVHVKRAILHILDTGAGIPVLSDTLLGLPIGIQEYLYKHLTRAMKDPDIKRTQFVDPPSRFCELVQQYKKDGESFTAVSQEIASLLFDFMLENVGVPSADLLVVDFIGDGEPYLGVLKLNYKHSYIHYVDHEAGRLNDILRQPCSLPTEGQRLDEFVIINLNTDQIFLKEKKFEIDDKKEYYLSNRLVLCEDVLSEKQTFDIVEKTVKKIIASEYNGDIEKLNTVKRVIADDYESDSVIDMDSIAQATFGDDFTVKERFREEAAKKGLTQSKVAVSDNIENKIFKKQKFVTDSGIELSIPTDYLMREDIVEFRNNPDGTISVEIKNIEGFVPK